MGEKDGFEYAEKMGVEEVADFLLALSTGLRDRKLKLSGRGKSMTLLPSDTVKLEVKAEGKEGNGSLEIEISWKDKYVASAEKLEVSYSVEEEENKASTK
jgi:amphi-Trp domain-containing protein